jgi:hypothetical protein
MGRRPLLPSLAAPARSAGVRLPFRCALALLGCLACAPEESSVGGVFATDTGLRAEYFDGRGLQRPSGVYQDATIDFAGWELNARIQARGHAARTVSIRWTGQIWFDRAGTHTMSFEHRGRVRLWIDDTLVIDDWRETGELREPRGTHPVGGAGWRDLRVEWDQFSGPMTARLRHQSPAQARAVVPAGHLRQPPDQTPDEPLGDFENVWDLPLSTVTGVAASPHGTVVAGVSGREDLFWDAWLVPAGGGQPRRLAPIGLTLLEVNASGALWTTIAGFDAPGEPRYDLWLSPADGTEARPATRR